MQAISVESVNRGQFKCLIRNMTIRALDFPRKLAHFSKQHVGKVAFGYSEHKLPVHKHFKIISKFIIIKSTKTPSVV